MWWWLMMLLLLLLPGEAGGEGAGGTAELWAALGFVGAGLFNTVITPIIPPGSPCPSAVGCEDVNWGSGGGGGPSGDGWGVGGSRVDGLVAI